MVRLARIANRPHSPPVDDLVDIHREHTLSRRRFLERAAATSAVAAATLAVPGCRATRGSGSPRSTPRVVIVGGGIAGLNAAYQLRRSGLRATVYEASARTGGRMFSSTGLLAPGVVTELGGEFIDSQHRDLLSLTRRFRLPLLDMQDRSEEDLIQEACFFQGRHWSSTEVVDAFRPLVARLEHDRAVWEQVADPRRPGPDAAALDATPLADYLDRIGASGFIRDLLDVAYLTEYGLECGEQSALNLVSLIGTDLSGETLQLFGDSDERFKIRGGNQRITDELAVRLDGQVQLGHRLTAVENHDSSVTLHFDVDGRGAVSQVVADFAILTVPFTLLRVVECRGEWPEIKRRAIAELGYGTNAKLFVGQSHRPWRQSGFAGNVFSDQGFQLAWDHSRLQGATAAGLTLYSGGRAGLEVGASAPEDHVTRLLPGVDRAFPGVIAARHGVAHRFHWPTHPFTRGSYSCYRPGQWTSLAGTEELPVGRILFAGEHCSRDFQGFMNGAAESGRIAAANLLAAARSR